MVQRASVLFVSFSLPSYAIPVSSLWLCCHANRKNQVNILTAFVNFTDHSHISIWMFRHDCFLLNKKKSLVICLIVFFLNKLLLRNFLVNWKNMNVLSNLWFILYNGHDALGIFNEFLPQSVQRFRITKYLSALSIFTVELRLTECVSKTSDLLRATNRFIVNSIHSESNAAIRLLYSLVW